MKRSESLAAQREPRKRGTSVTERRAAEDAEAAAAEEQRRRPQPKAKKRSTTAVVDENCVPGVSLLVLPDELLAHILRKCKLLSSYSHAAGVCTRLRVFVEDTCRLMLEEPNSWKYLPLEATYGPGVGSRLTWRTRLLFGFSEAYRATCKLIALRAGLVIFGSTCYQNGSAAREARMMTTC